MDAIKPPSSLKLCGNVDANWLTFKQHFQLLAKQNLRMKGRLLSYRCRGSIQQINFEEEADKKKLDKVLEKI